ncbi:hypothetical protein [Streptomyces sp. NPDC057702]|uniref:hypothetical protein n=1 Tax=Streptomyces sp. NPDC057702 TaxID=3346221 RepID=UPI0036B2334B
MTRESREAGYRDGARVAGVVSHVAAWGAGAKDGWKDTRTTAQKEKEALTRAHARRKAEKEAAAAAAERKKEGQMADPIGVTGVTAGDVLLGEGADQTSVSRGELRTLKSYERALEVKAKTMGHLTEVGRHLKGHAQMQDFRAQKLLESAKGVKGGEKVVAALTRLKERTADQIEKAEALRARALRGEEGCRVVLANVDTRYGAIYQAVVDSDETVPAELSFYKEAATSG